ncbi:uncharacterized protein LOC133729673 [Rosa rugosa]|uniref:uncharacterized protein LOC133729673 n=1 Tax=Rosa rugosa TaxID=74645 RepID=UPI002B4040D9|nr:uncharacterized protein LOC133729673 [Rosa rugosa]XP_062013224.1 uncharacterized protein LOC133729673 [Rosa rugosa]
MNDKSQLMNQPPPPMMSLSQAQAMSQPPPMMAQPPPPQMMAPSSQAMAAAVQQQQMMMNSQSQPLMMNRSYKAWPPQQQQQQQQFVAAQKPPQSNLGRNNWKGKKGNDKRRMEKNVPNLPLSGGQSSSGGGYNIPNLPLSGGQSSGGGGGGGGYIPPTLNELQSQNRMKARKFYPKKKFNNRFAPYAPRNTTSFIIRAKKSGGIASLVSPCPVTPAVLPTPIFSPSREVLGDTAKEEWGVDGYGSMKGLIRLRSPGNDDDEEGGGGSSESDVEEHVEVERRLDHDLSRFEMIYPNYSGVEYNNVLENRVDDQDTHIAQLEEENLTLKERLFLMERELGDLRRRMLFLERRHHVMEEVNEEVVENGSENDSDGGSDVPHMGIGGESNIEVVDYVSRNGGVRDVSLEEYVHGEMNLKENEVKDEVRNEVVGNEEIERKNEGRRNDLVGDGVVSEKVEEVRNEFIMNKVIANKTELVSSEVETKNENEFMQGQVNIEKAEDMVIACHEKNETKVMRNEVETKLENELMRGQMNAEKDEEMGTSCTENIKTEGQVKNEVETKNESELMQCQTNAQRDEEMGIASTEKSIGVGD